MKITIDIDDAMDDLNCFDPAIRYAIKKLLHASSLALNDRTRDIADARDALSRRLEMIAKDNAL